MKLPSTAKFMRTESFHLCMSNLICIFNFKYYHFARSIHYDSNFLLVQYYCFMKKLQSTSLHKFNFYNKSLASSISIQIRGLHCTLSTACQIYFCLSHFQQHVTYLMHVFFSLLHLPRTCMDVFNGTFCCRMDSTLCYHSGIVVGSQARPHRAGETQRGV